MTEISVTGILQTMRIITSRTQVGFPSYSLIAYIHEKTVPWSDQLKSLQSVSPGVYLAEFGVEARQFERVEKVFNRRPHTIILTFETNSWNEREIWDVTRIRSERKK